MAVRIYSNLQALVDAHGVSLRQLARDIDYDFETLRRFANDSATRYSRDLLERLCSYFECTPNDLLRLERTEEDA